MMYFVLGIIMFVLGSIANELGHFLDRKEK